MLTIALNCFQMTCKMNNKTYKIECPEDRKLLGIVVPTKKLKSNHVRTFQDGLLELVLDDDLSGDDLRTLLGMLAHLEYENKFTMSLTALSEKLKIPRPSLSKAVNKLAKKGYLTKEGSQGKVNHYMVDPRIAFKSRVSKFSKILDHWDNLPQTEY